MKLKKEYILLIGIIVVLLVYLIFSGGRNRIEYQIPKLSNIQSGEINRIDIIKSEQTIALNGKDQDWNISPQEYPADASKIKSMLEAIEGLKLTELAAEHQDYQRYDLNDEKKIAIKAYQSDTLLREFEIGKTSSTYRHTFIKLPDDDRVFYAAGSFRSEFESEIKDLRDKSVLKFEKNEISEITVVSDDGKFRFIKEIKTPSVTESDSGQEKEAEAEASPTPQPEEIWKTDDGKSGLKSEIDSILSSLSDLRCDEYIEDKNKDDMTDPVFTVILKGTKEYVIKIYAKQDVENGKYTAFSSETPYVFLLSTYTAESIIKKPEDLFEQIQNN